MPYPEMFVAPMRQELTRFGVKELRTAGEVDNAVTSFFRTLEPVIIFFMAIVVGSIVVSLFLPIVRIMQSMPAGG